ncbi:hypothetical protein BGZ94_006316 [Podila epigama]|nr:hypothetical protein BGZ94_006316 [Podila epigama]
MSKNPYFAHLPTWRNRQDLAYALDNLPRVLEIMTASSPLLATYTCPSPSSASAFAPTSLSTSLSSSSSSSSTTTTSSSSTSSSLRRSPSPPGLPPTAFSPSTSSASLPSSTTGPEGSSASSTQSSSHHTPAGGRSSPYFKERFMLDVTKELQDQSLNMNCGRQEQREAESPTSSERRRRDSGASVSSFTSKTVTSTASSHHEKSQRAYHPQQQQQQQQQQQYPSYHPQNTNNHLKTNHRASSGNMSGNQNYPLQFSTKAKAMAYLIEVLQWLQKEPCGCDLTKGCACGQDGYEDHIDKSPCYVCGEWYPDRKEYQDSTPTATQVNQGQHGQQQQQQQQSQYQNQYQHQQQQRSAQPPRQNGRAWHEQGSLRHHVAESRVKKWLELVWRPPLTPATSPEQENVQQFCRTTATVVSSPTSLSYPSTIPSPTRPFTATENPNHRPGMSAYPSPSAFSPPPSRTPSPQQQSRADRRSWPQLYDDSESIRHPHQQSTIWTFHDIEMEARRKSRSRQNSVQQQQQQQQQQHHYLPGRPLSPSVPFAPSSFSNGNESTTGFVYASASPPPMMDTHAHHYHPHPHSPSHPPPQQQQQQPELVARSARIRAQTYTDSPTPTYSVSPHEYETMDPSSSSSTAFSPSRQRSKKPTRASTTSACFVIPQEILDPSYRSPTLRIKSWTPPPPPQSQPMAQDTDSNNTKYNDSTTPSIAKTSTLNDASTVSTTPNKEEEATKDQMPLNRSTELDARMMQGLVQKSARLMDSVYYNETNNEANNDANHTSVPVPQVKSTTTLPPPPPQPQQQPQPVQLLFQFNFTSQRFKAAVEASMAKQRCEAEAANKKADNKVTSQEEEHAVKNVYKEAALHEDDGVTSTARPNIDISKEVGLQLGQRQQQQERKEEGKVSEEQPILQDVSLPSTTVSVSPAVEAEKEQPSIDTHAPLSVIKCMRTSREIMASSIQKSAPMSPMTPASASASTSTSMSVSASAFTHSSHPSPVKPTTAKTNWNSFQRLMIKMSKSDMALSRSTGIVQLEGA